MSDPLEAETRARIAQAQTLRGIPPKAIQLPYRSLDDLMGQRAEQYPDRTWLIHYDRGIRHEFTFGEFRRKVNQVAAWMWQALEIRPGDCVATLAYNHTDVLLVSFGAWRLGAAIAPQNTAEDDSRISYILQNSNSRALFCRTEYLARAERIRASLTHLEHIVELGDEPQSVPLHINAAAALSTDFEPPRAAGRDDECLLVYTSGTTGTPKGVMLTHLNLLVDAQAMVQWDQVTQADRYMTVLPVHHVNGLVVTHVAPLYAGASTVLNRQFHTSSFWRILAEEKVTISSVVPTLLQFLLESDEDIRQYDLARLRYLICGAGTLSVKLARRFEARFGIPIVHGYGLSEVTAYACHLPVDLTPAEHQNWLTAHGYPSIGCPLDVNEMAIFDAPGEGRELPAGERGEIAIRGHNVMQGYFQRPEANREAFRYGWFRSGDEGFYESDARGRKFFFITGRLKELINRGGVKFSPFEIEEVLAEIPGVRAGLAIAFENLYYGEEIGAYVVPEEGADLTEAIVLEHCRMRLGFEKSPKVVVLGKQAPVTATGKYQRLALRPLFEPWNETQFREPRGR